MSTAPATVIALRMPSWSGRTDDRESSTTRLLSTHTVRRWSEQAKGSVRHLDKGRRLPGPRMNAVKGGPEVAQTLLHGGPKDRSSPAGHVSAPAAEGRVMDEDPPALGAQFAGGSGRGRVSVASSLVRAWDGKGPRRLRGNLIRCRHGW